MKKSTIFLAFVLLPTFIFSQQTINGSLQHDGGQRTYILYIPANYTGDSSVPLVLNFHGYTSNAGAQMGYGDFRAIADTAGFIIVHPQGTLFEGNTHWNVGGWTLGSTTDDVGFTETLIDKLANEYNIDRNRVYSTGMSNGGYMSFLLACQLSEKIAAVASVTGSMTPQIYNNCDPQHPTPVLQVHGTTDGVVPYFGDTWTRAITDVISYWINYNHCNTTANTTDLPDINTQDASTVTHFVYAEGDDQSTVEHWQVTNGGHTWPGTVYTGPGTNQDFNASLEIWKFFSRYDINGLISSTSREEVAGKALQLQIFPNPATSHVQLKFEKIVKLDYQLNSASGQSVRSGSIQGDQHKIDLSDLTKGLYILEIEGNSYEILKTE